MNKRILTLGMAIVSTVLMAQDFEDREAAMLVTSVNVAKVNQGSILGYFPKVLISRFALDKSKGFFIFDADDIRGTKINTKLQGDKHIVEESEFIDKLQIQVPELKALPNTVMLVPSPTDITGFSDGKPLERFLMSAEKDYLKTAPILDSTVVQVGTRADIEKEYEKIKSNSNGGEYLYKKHFSSMALKMEVYESQPGSNEEKIGEVDGFALVKHRLQDTGFVAVPSFGGEENGILVPAIIKDEGANSYGFEFGSNEFVKDILVPALWEEGSEPNLKCYIPEDEEYKKKTACRLKGTEVVIEGSLKDIDNDSSKVQFYLMDPEVDYSVIRVVLSKGTISVMRETQGSSVEQSYEGPKAVRPVETGKKRGSLK